MKSLDRQIVLVTGATGGLGREITRQLLAQGCRLVLSDLRYDALVHLAAEQRNKAIIGLIAADLSTEHGCAELATAALRIAPTIDILVNNAGIAMSGPFFETPQARWEALIAVNLLAPMRLTTHLLPQMLERGHGHVVNIASCASLVGAAGLASYSTAKFGLRGFSEALYRDVQPHGVDVTAIYPFFTRTAILQSERFGNQTQALPEWMIGEPEFVMRQLIRGMRQRKLHIYPGAIARAIDVLRRVGG